MAPHAEAARHGQIQRLHCLRLEFTEHRLADGFELTVHFHLTHLQAKTGQVQYIPYTSLPGTNTQKLPWHNGQHLLEDPFSHEEQVNGT